MPVIVGYDGSEVSEHALRFAVDEAKMRGLPVEVVAAWEQPTIDLGMGSGATIDPTMSEVVAAHAVELANAAADKVRVSGVEASATHIAGSAAAALVDRCADADLLVVGSHGRHAVADLLLGGVSRQVAAHAKCPTIIVRADGAQHARVVVGIDGSDQAGRALDFAFDEASRRGWALRVVHAWDVAVIGFDVDSSTYPKGGILDDVEDAETRLGAEVLSGHVARYPDVELDVRIVRGAAAKALAEASKDASLLVVGSRGRGGFTSLLLGSISHKVIHHAACSVAVVH